MHGSKFPYILSFSLVVNHLRYVFVVSDNSNILVFSTPNDLRWVKWVIYPYFLWFFVLLISHLVGASNLWYYVKADIYSFSGLSSHETSISKISKILDYLIVKERRNLYRNQLEYIDDYLDSRRAQPARWSLDRECPILIPQLGIFYIVLTNPLSFPFNDSYGAEIFRECVK